MEYVVSTWKHPIWKQKNLISSTDKFEGKVAGLVHFYVLLHFFLVWVCKWMQVSYSMTYQIHIHTEVSEQPGQPFSVASARKQSVRLEIFISKCWCTENSCFCPRQPIPALHLQITTVCRHGGLGTFAPGDMFRHPWQCIALWHKGRKAPSLGSTLQA